MIDAHLHFFPRSTFAKLGAGSDADLVRAGIEPPPAEPEALDALGPDRLLFGTDSTVFPRGWRADVLDAQTAAMDRLGLSAAERVRILGGNAAELLSRLA